MKTLARLLCGACLAAAASSQAVPNSACQVAYTNAYMSSLQGDCQAYKGCTPPCQRLIDAVGTACRDEKYNESSVVEGKDAERSFVQKSMSSLQALGPADCKYSVGPAKKCDAACSMERVTGGEGKSDFELDHCLVLDPKSGQSSPEAVWRSCEGDCREKFESLADSCKGCQDPDLRNFFRDAGRKLSRCGIGNGKSCAELGPTLNTACCSGPNGKVGDGDDTCNINNLTMPVTCLDDPICIGATRTAAAVCPRNFTTLPKLMGLFVDCGGKQEQLFAADPVKTIAANWCADHEEALHDHDNQGFRRLGDKRTGEPLAYYEQADTLAVARRHLQDDMPGYPDDPECATAYSDVFTATLFGDCAANASDPSTMSCTGACQNKITNMLKKCKTETTSEKLEDGITVTHSFSQKAANALQALGGMDCAYHLGFQDCQFETCRIGEIGTRMQTAGCTSLFLFQDYKDWYGCKKEGGQPQDKKVQAACWKLFLNVSRSCSGCRDDKIPEVLAKTATDQAGHECEEVVNDKNVKTDSALDHRFCKEPQDVATKIQELCCAGTDGIVGTDDDPCTPAHEASIHPKEADVVWYTPDTCTSNPVCAEYVQALALNTCPSTFIESELGRRIFTDCGGEIRELISKGKPCDAPAFIKTIDDSYSDAPKKADKASPGIRNADWGSCYQNKSHGEIQGPYLQSGQRCDLTCMTGWCVDGAQPHCLSGVVTMLPNGGGTGGFFDYTAPMECKPQPVSTCKFPPNGGCDPLTTCEEHVIDLMGIVNRRTVTCGDCPPGYFGSGGAGCTDINECEIRENGGCDKNTKCTNSDGGYECSSCPTGFSGDPFRENGCCSSGSTLLKHGTSGAECLPCEADAVIYVDGNAQCNSDLADFMSLGHDGDAEWTGFFLVLLMVLVGGIVAAVCHLCSKKSYKDAGGRFEKVDVGSIGTGPSIYDSSWAR